MLESTDKYKNFRKDIRGNIMIYRGKYVYSTNNKGEL